MDRQIEQRDLCKWSRLDVCRRFAVRVADFFKAKLGIGSSPKEEEPCIEHPRPGRGV